MSCLVERQVIGFFVTFACIVCTINNMSTINTTLADLNEPTLHVRWAHTEDKATVPAVFVWISTRMWEVNPVWLRLDSEAGNKDYPTSSCTDVAPPTTTGMPTYSTSLSTTQAK